MIIIDEFSPNLLQSVTVFVDWRVGPLLVVDLHDGLDLLFCTHLFEVGCATFFVYALFNGGAQEGA